MDEAMEASKIYVRLNLSSFDSPLVGKILAISIKFTNDAGKIVIELSSGVNVRDDFFVFDKSILEPLEGLFSLLG